MRFTRGGAFFSTGTLAVGVAAIHSGNNLLYLLLGGMLATLTASSVVSSVMLRGLRVERRVVGPSPVHLPVLLEYRVSNGKRRVPSYAITLGERGLSETAYVAVVGPGEQVRAECSVRFEKRGTYDLDVLTVSTGFPFGLFVKVKRFVRTGELVIWPRNDRPRAHPLGGGAGGRPSTVSRAAAPLGARGDFRSLREYRPGDDRRDIHWRSSARAGEPVVREYLGDATTDLWLALDPRGSGGEEAERALEELASAVTAASREGRRYVVSVGSSVFRTDGGGSPLADVLTALARVDFAPDAEGPQAPDGALVFSESAPQGQWRIAMETAG